MFSQLSIILPALLAKNESASLAKLLPALKREASQAGREGTDHDFPDQSPSHRLTEMQHPPSRESGVGVFLFFTSYR